MTYYYDWPLVKMLYQKQKYADGFQGSRKMKTCGPQAE
jgi:hypothetical protein